MSARVKRPRSFPHWPARVLSTSALIGMLLGCATPSTVSESGSRLRPVSVEQARQCRFVKTIQFDDRIYAMGKTPGVMKAIGEAGLRNDIAAKAPEANAFAMTRDDSSWFVGTVSYQADALICP